MIKEKLKEYNKKYYQEHKDEFEVYRERHTQKYGKEYIARKSKSYYQKNKKRWRKYQRQLRQSYYIQWKEIVLGVFGSIECKECGYNKCFGVIDFHHREPKEKYILISHLFRLKPTPERIKEIKKCDMLCKNCHYEHHYFGSKIDRAMEVTRLRMTNKMEALKSWISELCWPKEPERFVEVLGESGMSDPDKSAYEHRYKFRIYTKTYRYQIIAIDRSEDGGYLGCQSSLRKSLPGEDWTRGSDLPDGSFVRETWDKILRAIARNEMVPLSDYILSGRNEVNGFGKGEWIREDSPLFDGEGIEEIPSSDDEDLK